MFKRILLLTKLLIQGGDFSFGSGGSIGSKRRLSLGKKIGKKIGLLIGYAILAVYVCGLSFFLGRSMTLQMVAMGMTAAIPQFVVPFICVSSVVFGFIYVVTAFYHTNNTETLLSMPFRPQEIIAGRYLQVMSYEYMTIGTFFFPFLLAFGIYSDQSLLFYPAMLIVLALLPFLASAPLAILIMLLMRFTKFFKNKDRFTVLSTLLIIAVSFGLSFRLNASLSSDLQEGSGLPTLSSETAQSIGRINWIFLGSDFAVDFLSAAHRPEGWLSGLAFVAATLAWTALLLWVAGKVYFKGVMSIGAYASKGKALNEHEKAALSGQKSRLANFVQKEYRVLMRTPAFFSNNVLMCFLMPVLMVVPSYIGFTNSGMDIASVRALIEPTLTDEMSFGQVGSLVLLIAVGVTLFMGGMNGIAAGAISREGQGAYLMKIYPYSFAKQILAKLLVATGFSLVSPLMIFVAAQIAFRFPLKIVLPVVPLVLLGIIMVNLLGLVSDMAMPKINWTNEQQAAKQNWNMLIEMFGSMLLAGLSVFLMYLAMTKSDHNYIIVLMTGILVQMLLIAVFAFVVVKLSSHTQRLISE